jgi:hypothetical protein
MRGNKFYLELPIEVAIVNQKPALVIRKFFCTDEKINIVLDLVKKNKSISARLFFKDEFKTILNLKEKGLA